jgi:hypothetical protein
VALRNGHPRNVLIHLQPLSVHLDPRLGYTDVVDAGITTFIGPVIDGVRVGHGDGVVWMPPFQASRPLTYL